METEHRLLFLDAIENVAKSDISDAELGSWIRVTLKTFALCGEGLKLIEKNDKGPAD